MSQLEKGIYQHYKGQYYQVIDTVVHSETLEILVLYKMLYSTFDYPEGTLWVRPLNMFLETVTFNGEDLPRFRKTEDFNS